MTEPSLSPTPEPTPEPARREFPCAEAARSESAHAELAQAELERQKLAALVEMSAGLGHMVNPVLSVISGRAQLLLQEERDADRRRSLAVINTQAKRIYEMIADLMQFARPREPELERVELDAAIAEVIQQLATEAASRHVRIEHTGTRSVSVFADRAQLVVLLFAIVENAMHAATLGGWVEVRTGDRLRDGASFGGDSAGVATIEVIDNGHGFDEPALAHAFEPFFSGYNVGRGLGLGLSKAWRFARLIGGDVQIRNNTDRGATVTITLPLAKAPV